MSRFTVIIPLYNKENYIVATLQSVLDQSFSDFEVIVVSDCGTDNSLEIAKEFKDPRIKIIEHSENKGLSASRNTGIKNATSNYIAFLDADDLWKNDFLEKIDFLIKEYSEASIFATKYEVRLANGKSITFPFDIPGFDEHGIVPNFFESNLNQTIYYPSCLCVHKKVFETVGVYNESINYSEDVDFNIRAHEAFKMAYYNSPLVIYLAASENQITQGSLLGKTIPDYDFYEGLFGSRSDIKKYLDFQRYLMAKIFKLSGDSETFQKLTKNIDFKNLTAKQRILLRSPKMITKAITRGKLLLQKIGIEVNSY
ncbi:glycosyltransferase family 2 protein [Ulvibacter antarcticus]|uniref:GT2 family glycosyltransferase n=1 Tax=Ulvibacter antarcticus TaxID=442714 RepID=A0A3L9Y7P9_9FLAO|nr:glycosyltransferase family A protein [Ulvibacter antarcticus]RMA56731.1 GT2 family glycosyltransferase [Ulvibacter antarcticus]